MEYKLGDLVQMDSGYAFKSNLFNDECNGMPIIRIRDVNSGKSNTYFSGEYDEKYIVNNNEMLISMDGSFVIKKWNGGKALLNQRVCRIKSRNSILLDDYIYRILPFKLKKIEDATPFVTVKHLSIKTVEEIQISIPNIEEQKKIIKLLDISQELIDKRKAQIEALDELVKSKFIEMFGDPVKNTMNWDMVTLSEVGSIGRGVSKHRPRNAPELLGGDYPLIQTGDVANAELYIKDYKATYSELGLKQSKLWRKGTLCITIAANIAKTGILTFDACFPDSVVGFIAEEKTNNIFMYYWFSSFQKLLEEQAPESAQKNINLKILSDLKVIIPPIELQNQFSDFVNQVDKLKFEMQKSLEEMENNFNSLMQKAFKGELFNEL
ncbi:MAG: restriction endonuclease subunit S [Clostridium beijerinckii]